MKRYPMIESKLVSGLWIKMPKVSHLKLDDTSKFKYIFWIITCIYNDQVLRH